MHGPLYSTITLFAEILISVIIYYTLYQGYKHSQFPVKLVALALFYELAFNISYMALQVPEHAKAAPVTTPFVLGLAIVHGVLSLIMFIALVVFFVLAWRHYRSGVNYFKAHSFFTILFLVFWTFSIVSGILLYLVSYL